MYIYIYIIYPQFDSIWTHQFDSISKALAGVAEKGTSERLDWMWAPELAVGPLMQIYPSAGGPQRDPPWDSVQFNTVCLLKKLNICSFLNFI